MKRSVREAALSSQSYNLESSQDSRSDDSSEHFFVPLPGSGLSRLDQEKKPNSLKSRQLFTAQTDPSLLEACAPDNHFGGKYNGISYMLNDLDSLNDFDSVKGFLSAIGSNSSVSDAHRSFYDMDETQDQIFSPPLLLDTSLFADTYEDLLGMLM